MARPQYSFYETITEAVNDIKAHGYDSQARIARWLNTIRDSALRSLTPAPVLERELKSTFQTIYTRMVTNGGLLKLNPGVSRFGIEKVKPELRAELVRRQASAAGLIKLNRESAILKTQQRFSGWATSVPAGGSDAVDKVETKTGIRKALSQLPFEERRVAIDQGHKFTANLNEIVAVHNGAIAGEWHSHFRQKGYDYREDHKERDSLIYLVRGNWALEKGFVKPGPAGYLDQITQPGEEVNCRCYCTFLYSLRKLPASMLTKAGKEAYDKVKL